MFLFYFFSKHILCYSLGLPCRNKNGCNNENTIQSQYEKTYHLKYTPNEDSNQHAHLRSLIKVFPVHMKKRSALAIQNKASDQTSWMRRLIWIFAGYTCPRVRFLSLQLNSVTYVVIILRSALIISSRTVSSDFSISTERRKRIIYLKCSINPDSLDMKQLLQTYSIIMQIHL